MSLKRVRVFVNRWGTYRVLNEYRITNNFRDEKLSRNTVSREKKVSRKGVEVGRGLGIYACACPQTRGVWKFWGKISQYFKNQ